jgi:integrase
MNVKKLQETYPQFISNMESNGYSWNYIKNFTSEINHILSEPNPEKWSSYADVYQGYAKKSLSKSHLCLKRVVLGAIERFDLYGQYPNGEKHQGIMSCTKYSLLTQEFKDAVDYYNAAEKSRGRKETSVANCAQSIACFLYSLQQKGFKSFEQITDEAILSAFVSADGKSRYSYSYKRIIVSFFKTCLPQSPDMFGKLLAYIPPIRAGRKNIKYLFPEESEKIKHVLTSTESPLLLRDKAIGMLAMHTGLRRCDISNLTLDSFDWEKDLISIHQQKTGVPIELPLRAIVGNVVYDYMTLERAETECEYMFLSTKRPYGRLKSRSLNAISIKIMNAAGVRQAGDRRGLHLFRHRLATTLLANGIPRPVISKTLGQESPNSLDVYLSADFPHLKLCALSIERFPIAKEVFCET